MAAVCMVVNGTERPVPPGTGTMAPGMGMNADGAGRQMAAPNAHRQGVGFGRMKSGRRGGSSANRSRLDRQESVLKMLAMGSEEENPVEQLRDLNIVPLTISYEYDPCDYLKAMEFQLKRDNPAYKKSKADDEKNMREGIWGFKGRIHYEAAHCINTWIDDLKDLPRNEFFTELARRMDQQIHAGYKLFPGNYVAADTLNGTTEFTAYYTGKQEKEFLDYLQQRLDKIELENKDEAFLRERLLTMYSNPVYNKQKAMNP